MVSDQIGSPTYTADLAPLLCDMAMTERFGTYHATNEGYCSWYEFAREIMRLGHLPAKIHPVATADYPSPAARPLNSRLSKESLDEAVFRDCHIGRMLCSGIYPNWQLQKRKGFSRPFKRST